MPIGLNSNLENKIPGPTVAMFFHAFKHELKAFSGWAFFNGWISQHDRDEMTCPTAIIDDSLLLHTCSTTELGVPSVVPCYR